MARTEGCRLDARRSQLPMLALQPEDLKFRQTPTFKDCFPGSQKMYKTVEHNGSTMEVGAIHICVAFR